MTAIGRDEPRAMGGCGGCAALARALLLAAALAGATPASAAQAPLAAAERAFHDGEYARSEALALEVARPPQEGAALYLAGLARFRAGRPAEALAALEAAAAAADPPPRGAWAYNRAACLDALGRSREAESSYREAATLDPDLAALALVNAGHAALDAGGEGAAERARTFAREARAVAHGPAAELVGELEARLDGAGGAAASEAEPAPPRGLLARGAGFHAELRAGAGWDSDVAQAGSVVDREGQPGSAASGASAFGALDAVGLWRGALGPDLATEVSYGLGQVAYADSGSSDLSLQAHELAAGLELLAGPRLRLGLGAEGQLAFTGLSRFRALQRSAGARAWLALDEAGGAVTRLDLGLARKAAASAEFAELTGWRLEAALGQRVRLGPVTLDLGYRLRDEAVGDARQALGVAGAGEECPGCTVTLVTPLAYTGHRVLVAAARPLGARAAIGLSAGLEWRRYAAASRLEQRGPDGGVGVAGGGHRNDTRLAAGAWAAVRLAPHLDLALRYDLVTTSSRASGRPSLAGRCGVNEEECPAAVTDPSFTRHALELEATLRW